MNKHSFTVEFEVNDYKHRNKHGTVNFKEVARTLRGVADSLDEGKTNGEIFFKHDLIGYFAVV